MPKIRRPRESHSCRTCRRRRVRCDKVHPACSRCVESRLTCIYPDRNLRAVPSPDAEDADQKDAALVSRSGINNGQIRTRDSRASTSHPVEQGHLEVGQNGFSYHASSTFWGNSSRQLGSDLGRLLLNVSSSRASSSGDSLTGIDRSNSTLGAFSRRPPVFNKSEDYTQTCQGCGSRLNITCLLTMLPDKDMCDRLCAFFFTTVYPLMPILHQPSFLEQYQAFWAENRDRNWHVAGPGQVVRRDPSLVCLIFSMLFVAAVIGSAETFNFPSDEAQDVFSGDLYFATMASLNLTGFPRRATHFSLAAYLFAQLQLSREEEFLDSPTFVSTSFRTALSMGLHRDGQAFGCTPIQIETRRKLWWHVIHLDTMIASSSGLPPLFINENISNTNTISVYQDESQHHAGVGGNRTTFPQVDVRHLVATCRYRITRELRLIICKHLECRLTTLGDVEESIADLDELRKSIWSTIDLLSSQPAPAASTPMVMDAYGVQQAMSSKDWTLSSTSPTVHTFRRFASIMLHLMLHKLYIQLLQPLIKIPSPTPSTPPGPASRKNSKNNNSTGMEGGGGGGGIWHQIRPLALHHSHAFLRLFVHLVTDPAFGHYSWMYPGTYQPLQPLSLILADLIESGNAASEDEQTQTSIGLVDAVFALYRVGEGVVSGGGGGENVPTSVVGGAGGGYLDAGCYDLDANTNTSSLFPAPPTEAAVFGVLGANGFTPSQSVPNGGGGGGGGGAMNRKPRRRNLSRVGQEAWAFLFSARRKALLRLGQDPHVLLPLPLPLPRSGAGFCGVGCPGAGAGAGAGASSKQTQVKDPRASQSHNTQQQVHSTFSSSSAVNHSTNTIPRPIETAYADAPQTLAPDRATGSIAATERMNEGEMVEETAATASAAAAVVGVEHTPYSGALLPPPTTMDKVDGTNQTNGMHGMHGMEGMEEAEFGNDMRNHGTGTTSCSEWQDLLSSAQGFDWDEWDTVLGGAIGSLV